MLTMSQQERRFNFVLGLNGPTMTSSDMWIAANADTREAVGEAIGGLRQFGNNLLTDAALAVQDGYTTHRKAMDWLVRHRRLATVAGIALGVAYNLDKVGFGNATVHAQGADQPLRCEQIDGVLAAQDSPERVVQPFINDGTIASNRVLECVDSTGLPQQRVLDCEGIGAAGYVLDTQSTNESPLCMDNGGALQPVHNGALDNVRAALRSMFPRIEAVPTQPIAQAPVATPDPYTATEQAVNTIKSLPWMLKQCWPVPLVGAAGLGIFAWWNRRQANQSNQMVADLNEASRQAEADRLIKIKENKQAQDTWRKENPLQGLPSINTPVGSMIDGLLERANLAATEGNPRERRALLAQALTEAEKSNRHYEGGGVGITGAELAAIQSSISEQLEDHTRRAAGGGYGTGTRRPRDLED